MKGAFLYAAKILQGETFLKFGQPVFQRLGQEKLLSEDGQTRGGDLGQVFFFTEIVFQIAVERLQVFGDVS